APCLEASVPVKAGDLGPLVDSQSAVDKPLPEPEREPRRLDGRGDPLQRAAEEERRVAARPDLVSGKRRDLLGRSELSRRLDGRLRRAHLRGRRRHAQLGWRAIPGVDLVLAAPVADSVHRILGRAADGERGGVTRALPKDLDVAPERLAEASVPPARAVPAESGLEKDDIRARLEVEKVPRRPEAEIAAADDRDVGTRVPLERA